MGNIRLKARLPMPERLGEEYTEEEFQNLPKWKRVELRNPNRKKLPKDSKGNRMWDISKWAYYLKRQYGITEEQYWVMYEEQSGVCAICKKPEITKRVPSIYYKTSIIRRLCIDHSHITNTIRGLLCNHCNSMLGNALDSVETLHSAISYLNKNGSGI